MDHYIFDCSDMHKFGETCITTMQRYDTVIVKRSMKKDCSLTSGYRETLVTVTIAVNEIEIIISLVFVFSRRKHRKYFVARCMGSANQFGLM